MDVQGITIDSKSTRDRDDAIWVETDGRGWTVTVCIANVAAAISRGSPFDETAYRRVETSYLSGDRNRPMLPRRFAEGSCSLAEGQERPVMGIRMRLDHSLEPQFLTIDESTLVNKKQLSYDEIPGILKDENHSLHTEISSLANLSNYLMEKRRREGAFVLYDLNTGWVTSEEGYLRRLKDTQETIGYIIVQEMMILANMQLAKFCAENEIPAPFRNHTARASAPDREVMMERINLGVHGAIADLATARKQFNLVMNKAVYGPTIEGHYGLNLPAYLHGTSPIRRYADLIVQRQILAHLHRRELPYSFEEIREVSEHINAALEAKAKEASQAALERANRQAELAIRKDDLEHISDKEFERVVKVAVRSESFNHVVAEAFLHRLKSGRASLADMHFILFHSTDDWQPIRRSIVRHLIENPNKATSIATIASQVDGWSEPKFNVQRRGAGHAVVHSVQARFKKPGLQSRFVTTPSLKLAKQRAIAEVIALAVQEASPNWDEAEMPKPVDQSLPDKGADNPIGALMEYCQRVGADLPVYESRRDGGADHEPKFVTSCSALDFKVESPPMASKKLSKRHAASMVIKLIHAKETQ